MEENNNMDLNTNCQGNYAINYWRIIDRLDWFNTSILNNPNEQMGDKILAEFHNPHSIADFKNFVVDKRKILESFIYQWLRKLPKEEKEQWGFPYISNDKIWDLASHIVGLGEVMYFKVMLSPQILFSFTPQEVVENFEYGFEYAQSKLALENEMLDCHNKLNCAECPHNQTITAYN